MPRRNVALLFAAALGSLLCYQRADRHPYARSLNYVLRAIDRKLLEPIPPRVLFDGAMEGIAAELDDYSAYINDLDAAQFEADLEQQFGGIGVLVRLLPAEDAAEGEEVIRYPTVMGPPRPGTPARRAGVRGGDRIVAIDGVETARMPMIDVIRRMRGEIGTPVELRLLHPDDDEPRDVSIVREVINLPSVMGDLPREDGSWDFLLPHDRRIGYVRVVSFGEKTYDELTAALETLRHQGARAAVIDLRDNPGGLLESAVLTCELFLPGEETIVRIQGRGGRLEREYRSSGGGVYADLPLVILLNGFSASASEIVAACLQDHGRAVVVGARSWGKGTVQHVIRTGAGDSLLKLTSASYWRPSGRNIHRLRDAPPEDAWGVQPDPGFEVPLSPEEALALQRARSERDILPDRADGAPPEPLDDPAVQRAVDYLQRQLGPPAARKAA